MARLTVDQDMKLGSALDQLEDAIEAAYTSLKMVRWAQLIVARYAGGILGPELNTKIRTVPLDLEKLWDLTRFATKAEQERRRELIEFLEDHNQKILDAIVAHEH
jgi:hypothetical protein